MIRTSTHSTKFLNQRKRDRLIDFYGAYRDAVQFYVDYGWSHFQNDPIPKYLITKDLYPAGSPLSQRALKCSATQAMGILRACLVKNQRRKYINKKFNKNITLADVSKPIINENFNLELNSICCDIKLTSDGEFDGFVRLKSIGKSFGHIKIPFKHHRHSRKMEGMGELMTSIGIREGFIDLRWEMNIAPIKEAGEVVGADQGIINALTLSDKQVSSLDCHGHDLKTIISKLARKKAGSKSFKKAQEHRKNYINWSINQLNFGNIRELRLEKLKNVRRGKRVNRNLKHFTYTIIREKIKAVCEQNGVRFVEQDNKFRSQRCSDCGYTHKHNRKGVIFRCLSCNMEKDADLNAALNHAIDLPEVPDVVFREKWNLKGFSWKPGVEFTVPHVSKSN